LLCWQPLLKKVFETHDLGRMEFTDLPVLGECFPVHKLHVLRRPFFGLCEFSHIQNGSFADKVDKVCLFILFEEIAAFSYSIFKH
jgi:hypothetical protein